MLRAVFFLLLLVFSGTVHAQEQPRRIMLDEKTVVKDAEGKSYSVMEWQQLLYKGYALKIVNATPPYEFLIYKMTEEEIERQMAAMPKPAETNLFTTGSEVLNLKATDMNGVKYDLKDLAGKVVVVNFWFINCGPCRMEIPELNQTVEKFKDNKNVVFLAVGLDPVQDVKSFLKTIPFNYNIIPDGQWIANMYKVRAYPTHLILDQQGKVAFHTAGYGQNTVYWINKSIKEALAKASASQSGD